MLNVKIKLSTILFLVLAGFLAQGQTPSDSVKGTDSTQIKLDAYKKLLDSGVIGEDEYNKMKSELQNAKQQPTIAAPSQTATSDSTQLKLAQLKKLYDTGVISEDEYSRSTAKLLGLPPPTETKPDIKPDLTITKADTMNLEALKARSKSKVIAGSVILSVGGAFIIGDILLSSLPSLKLNPKDSLYSDELTTRRGAQAALGVLGGVASIGGAVFLALGLKDRAIFRRRNKSLTMNFNGKEIELAFVF
jgi:hypothetical protein